MCVCYKKRNNKKSPHFYKSIFVYSLNHLKGIMTPLLIVRFDTLFIDILISQKFSFLFFNFQIIHLDQN